jgi:hypothetical protein
MSHDELGPNPGERRNRGNRRGDVRIEEPVPGVAVVDEHTVSGGDAAVGDDRDRVVR